MNGTKEPSNRKKYVEHFRELGPVGACHYCNSYIRGKDLFCCEECEQDWLRDKEYEQRSNISEH